MGTPHDDYEELAKIEAAYIALEHAIKSAMPIVLIHNNILDVFLSRLAQARAESRWPRAFDDARIAAGYEQCASCGDTLTPDKRTGVLDLCTVCASVARHRCDAK